jgi:hypothetical protein
MARNYYEELNVLPSSSTEEIKQAYRSLARKYHPDANPGRITANRFTAISEAYQTLIDPKKRVAYNQTLLLKRQTNNLTTDSSLLLKNELRLAYWRVSAYAATGVGLFLGFEWFIIWLMQSNLTNKLLTHYVFMGSIGFTLGLFWGIDVNFVISDFIIKPIQLFIFRCLRFIVWILGLLLVGNQINSLIIRSNENIDRYHLLPIMATIGLFVATISTIRDH